MEVKSTGNDAETEKMTLTSMNGEKEEIKFKKSFDKTDSLFPVPNFGVDVSDLPMSKARVSLWDIFWICVSILTHLIDIGADLNLARSYYVEGMLGYFIWTVAFLFIPSFINTVVSIRMYNQDREVTPLQKDPKKKKTISSTNFDKTYVIILI